MTTLASVAGISALMAAAATVVGAITLIAFFSRGQPWGTINDVASIVVMVATVPVAYALASLHGLHQPLAMITLVEGVVGMAGASIAQALLVAGVRTYEQLLPWTLGFGAVVGVWYLLVGLLGRGTPLRGGLDLLAIASGIAFIALGYGFLRGNERHPLSIVGGVVLLVSSTWFLGWLGLDLLAGRLTVGALGPLEAIS